MGRLFYLAVLSSLLLLLSFYSSIEGPGRYPDISAILSHPERFEGVAVRGAGAVESYLPSGDLQLLFEDRSYSLSIQRGLLERDPGPGDTVAYEGVSYLATRGAIVASQVHVTSPEDHNLVFLRSLLALPLILFAFAGGYRCRTG